MLVHFLKTVDREDSGYPCQCKHDHVLACVGREDLGCPCQSPIINHQLSIINENIMSCHDRWWQEWLGLSLLIMNYQLSLLSSSWQVVARSTKGQLAATRWHWSTRIIILGERCDDDNWYSSILINTIINYDLTSWWKERCVWYPFRSPRSRSSRCQRTTIQRWAPAHHLWCRWVVLSRCY